METCGSKKSLFRELSVREDEIEISISSSSMNLSFCWPKIVICFIMCFPFCKCMRLYGCYVLNLVRIS